MPHSFGYRARTRDLFSKGRREAGTIATGRFLTTYRLGDIVDIKGDSAQQKGMPHKYYHGKTGRVWNVTKRAIGVEVNKQVRGRCLLKRVHLRIEHVRHSKCRTDFLDRVQSNDKKRAEAKKAGVHVVLKRLPAQPLKAGHVKTSKTKIVTMSAVPFPGLGL